MSKFQSVVERPSSDQETQRLNALSGANDVRIARADVRRQLERFELDFDEFLDETPEPCLKVSLFKLLTWLPNVGRTRARKIVRTLHVDEPSISEDTQIGEIGPREKCRLYGLVEPHLEEYRRVYLQAAA